MKTQRKFYCNDKQFQQLKKKAKETFRGKGYISKYLRKIAEAKSVFIVEGQGEIKITVK